MKKLLLALPLLLLPNVGDLWAQNPTNEQLLLIQNAELIENQEPQYSIKNNTSRQRNYSSKTPTTQHYPTTNASTLYGSDIFSNKQLSFSPSLNIPTPLSYKIASGDELLIVLWGAAEAEYNLEVSPDGNIIIPKVGVVHIAGLNFEAAQKLIRQRLSAHFTGLLDGSIECTVTLGNIRSISVNIVGEANTPGTYTLPSLATLFNALYSAGGVSNLGSLRDIRLYRGGELLSTLDVYDYLINGNNDIDLRLEDNDLIVISTQQRVVTISGNVRRPMSYELTNGESIEDLLYYAGGLASDAYIEALSVVRSANGDQLSLHSVPNSKFNEFVLLDGDSLTVGTITQRFSNRVIAQGALWREGEYELCDSLSTVTELIQRADGLRDDAYSGRAQILRILPDLSLEIIPFDVDKILCGQSPDIELAREDIVKIFSVDELSEDQNIKVLGEVNNPNTFYFASGMTLGDALLLARGFKSSAALSRVEVARRITSQYDTVATPLCAELFSFAVNEDLSLTQNDKNFLLKPFDEIYIRRSPGYIEQQVVYISGEVNFAGAYAMVTANDRLSDLVKAAGGLSEFAYTKGASLLRQYTAEDLVRQRSLRHITMMMKDERSRKEESDSTTLDEYEEIKVGEYYSVGIDLSLALENPSGTANLQLKRGDKLNIPTLNNTITVVGAVYYPNTMSYSTRFSVKDYIKRAGGYSNYARRKPFVIEVNGNVMAASKCDKLSPGSQIVVPYKPYREPLNVQGWIGISSSIVSMAAMVMALIL